MKLKAIGFDLDDTLYSRKDFYEHVFDKMQTSVAYLNISFDRFYERFQIYSDAEYEKFMRREKDRDAYKNDRVISTYKYFDTQITVDAAVIFNALYLYYRNKIEYRVGVVETLEYLKKQGYKLFVLTNGPMRDQLNKLEQLQIEKYISREDWYISDELNTTKPEKKIFKIVENRIEFQGNEILYIGDSFENDILGASQLGWETVYLKVHDVGIELANKVSANSFTEILEIIKEGEKNV